MQLVVHGTLNATKTPDVEDQACEIGIHACILIMEITRQVSTNTPVVTDRTAPINQFYFPFAYFLYCCAT